MAPMSRSIRRNANIVYAVHAAIRLEMRHMGVAIVREIAALGSTLRQEMADQGPNCSSDPSRSGSASSSALAGLMRSCGAPFC